MHEYTPEELVSLTNICLKSLFALQYFDGENGRQIEWEAKGGFVDDVEKNRLVYLCILYLGFMWELYLFLETNDQALISLLKSTKGQRSHLKDMRNSTFHVTSSKIEKGRFENFKSVTSGKDWQAIYFQDLKIIGNYIYELHQVKNPKHALLFQNFWMRIWPFH